MQRIARVTAATAHSLIAAGGLPGAEARALLAQVLGTSRERLVAHPELVVDDRAHRAFRGLAARRRSGEPMAYLLGAREFHGRSFRVTPAVLIPRPETELLVELALARIEARVRPALLELGTGSGCIAITLALQRPDARVTAIERSRAALAVARANATDLGATVDWIEANWYAQTAAAAHFDLIVANPPYVRAGDPHLEALRHEPVEALVAGAGGLDDLRQIVAGAPARLRPGGWLAVEHGYDQAAPVAALFASAGFAQIGCHHDLQGHPRVTLGQVAQRGA